MGKCYRKKKYEFDRMVYAYLVKRLREPITASDSFRSGAVDEFGAPKTDNMKGNWAYTCLDRLIFDIKAELGDKVNVLGNDFDDMNSYSLMTRGLGKTPYHDVYDGIVSIIEKSAYLPAGVSDDDVYVADDESLTYDERVSRALTVATYLMFGIKNDHVPTELEFDEVLDSTEATFDVRSIGSNEEITEYLKKSGLVSGKQLTDSGYVLAVRAAKWIVGHGLCSDSPDVENMCRNWRQLSSAG